MSLWRFAREFLEAEIFPKRIPKWIVAEIGDGNSSWNFEKIWKCGDRGIEIAEARLDLCESRLGPRLFYRITVVILHSTLRLVQRLFLFSKPGISERQSIRGAGRVGWNRSIRFRFNPFNCAGKTS